jgi:hypothetical protein
MMKFIAVLGWLSFFTLTWMIIFGFFEDRAGQAIFVFIFFLFISFVATMMHEAKESEKKNK